MDLEQHLVSCIPFIWEFVHNGEKIESMAEPVDPARVIAEHQQLQELRGDCLSDGAQPRLPSQVTVSFPRGDLIILKEIWRKMSAEGH